ncbi:MAG: RNA-binding S4 domain-containing protein [Bacteroidales bacterium]
MKQDSSIRIDKWLWAVRLFKTRSLATQACKSNKVLIDGQAVKPSREVHIHDVIVINLKELVRTVQVKDLLGNRVGAKLVEIYMSDLTPKEEFDKLKIKQEVNYEFRERGLGRPTKKERRIIEKLKKSKF